MKDVERAYLAGLFDGEGSASVIYSHYTRRKRKRLYDSYKVQLIISNKDIRVLKEIRLLFGKGGIYPANGSYDFRISKPTDIIEMIELIKSYIRVRKPDLDNLYTASKFILKVRGSSERHRWTEEEKDEFLKFVETSQALKGPRGRKRGRPRKYPL